MAVLRNNQSHLKIQNNMNLIGAIYIRASKLSSHAGQI